MRITDGLTDDELVIERALVDFYQQRGGEPSDWLKVLWARWAEESDANPAETGAGQSVGGVALDPYHGARFVTSLNEAALACYSMDFAVGKNKYEKEWLPGNAPTIEVLRSLTNHVVGKKDDRAVVFGGMDKGRRLKKALKSCTAIPFDYDTGVRSAELDAALATTGWLCVRYTSHSHGKTATDVGQEAVKRFAGLDCEISTELLQRFVREEMHWETWIVPTVKYEGEHHTSNGYVYRIAHDPMPKHRVVVFIKEPFVMRQESAEHAKALETWEGIVQTVGNKIGFRFDPACLIPSQPYYLPRHERGRPYEVSVFGGDLLDWRSLDVAQDQPFDGVAAECRKSGKKSKTRHGQGLGIWAHKVADGFQVVDFMEDHCDDRIRGYANGGITIECPNDAAHGKPGDTSDTGCWAKNADGDGLFVISCRHSSCRDLTMLDMVGLMLEQKWFPRTALDDPEYDALDRDAEAGSKLVAEPDYKALLDGLQVSNDQHGDTIKIVDGALKAGLDALAIDALKKKIREASGMKDKMPLNNLVKERKAAASAKKFSDSRGPEAKFWFNKEKMLVEAMEKARLAVVSLGAHRRFVVFDHKDTPQFLQKSDAEIAFAQYQYFREAGGNGEDGFKVWLRSPHRFSGYDEVVFQPGDKPVAANVLNLWRGWGVEPKPGDWSFMKDHIKTIICDGDEIAFKYYLAWWAHMFQDPTTKPGVAPALVGPKGCGKSILPYYVRKLIPKNSKVVEKPKSWLGTFNDGLAHCLLLCVEEAMFAGNHEHDAAMKHLITSDELRYEAKYQHAVEGPNYTRVHFTSNEERAVPATPGERRYLVMKVNPAKVGDYDYFNAIAHEMENGGCEAFLYDMLHHDYSDVNVRAAPETDGLRDQILNGLDPKLKWLASVLEDGAFPFKDGPGPEVTSWVDAAPQSRSRSYAADREEYEIGVAGGTIPKALVFASYRDFCPAFRGADTDETIALFLKGVGFDLKTTRMTMANGGRPWGYVFPALKDMRDAFLKLVPTHRFG